jgi:hypothetical protein
MTASPWCRMSRAFFGVPTTPPTRDKNTLKKGRVGSQYSPMPRSGRGGSASSTVATPIIAASSAICPAWLPITSMRPAGSRSSPVV